MRQEEIIAKWKVTYNKHLKEGIYNSPMKIMAYPYNGRSQKRMINANLCIVACIENHTFECLVISKEDMSLIKDQIQFLDLSAQFEINEKTILHKNGGIIFHKNGGIIKLKTKHK